MNSEALRPKAKLAGWILAGLLVAGCVARAGEEARKDAAPAGAAAEQEQPKVPAQIEGFPKEAEVAANRTGFCLDLGCGDGKLSAEIAAKTNYTIFALAKDDTDCQKARLALERTGLFGTRATAMAGSLKKLPLPDCYGNLIVTGEYREELDLKEVFRVLSPTGVAIVGGGAAEAEKLKSALEAAGIKDYRFAGNHAIFHGKMPEGVSHWTHWTPRPDNISTSYETKVRPPFRTQWLLPEPSYDDCPSQHAAVAEGRLISRFNRYGGGVANRDRICAFDAFNGSVLWERQVPKGGRNKNRYALVDGVCYWTGNSGVVDAYDPETGRLLRSYQIPGAGYSCWLAVENGVLYALGRAGPSSPGEPFGAGDLFCAFNLKNGEMLWKYECKNPVPMQSAALDSRGGLYFYRLEKMQAEANKEEAEKKKEAAISWKGTACALDVKTGQERWHCDLGVMATYYVHMCTAGIIDEKYFVWSCLDQKGVIGTKALDAKTGQVVKEYPGVWSNSEGAVAQVLFVNGKMYCQPRGQHTPYFCYDMATGEKLKTGIDQFKAGMHPGTASMNCIYTGSTNFRVQDFEAGKEWSDPYIRFSDHAAPTVAHGMIFRMPAVCRCPHNMDGPVALAPAGENWPPEANQELDARLTAGPALDAPLVDDAQEEWTHYRATPGHIGEVAIAPKTPLTLGWERKLGRRITPPSFGAGLAFCASRDGLVWGLDQATGEVRWKFLSGACVRVTPAYARGRVLVGSYDGCVYCLEAKTGKLVWRFRVAPQERYINLEGQMNSLWPSAAGVIVEGDSVYCAAGLQAYDGTYLYALDLRTGKAVWAKRIGDLDNNWGSPQGIMALAGDTLVVPVFPGRLNRAYRKTDGEAVPTFKGCDGWKYGSEAVADGDVWFYGGDKHGDHLPGSRTAGPSPFSPLDLKTGWFYGKTTLKTQKVIAPNLIPPVLGKQVIVGDGSVYDRAKFLEALRTDPQSADLAKLWSVTLWPSADPKRSPTSALVLAGDVLLASGASEVVAFEAKADGKELGRLAVPGKITRNTLSVAGGRIFVVTDEDTIRCLSGE